MIYSDSEIARLRKVIVHRPDDGIGRVSPKRAEELFKEIVETKTISFDLIIEAHIHLCDILLTVQDQIPRANEEGQ